MAISEDIRPDQQANTVVQPPRELQEQFSESEVLGRDYMGAVVTAEQTTREFVETTDDDETEPEMFGLERELKKYDELWDVHAAVIQDYMTENEAVLFAPLSGFTKDSRMLKRKAQNVTEQNTESLIAVYITAGRFSAIETYASLEGTDLHQIGVSSLVPSSFVRGEMADSDLARIDNKRERLLGGLLPIPSVASVQEGLWALESNISRSYLPILRKAGEISRVVYQRIADNPFEARKFLDEFLDCADSESEAERTFAAFFGNDYAISPGSSLIGVALQVITEATGKDVFAEEFIAKQLEDGESTLSFVQYVVQKLGGDHDALQDVLVGGLAKWPLELKSAYETYTTTMLQKYTTRPQRAASLSVRRQWINLDPTVYEDDINVLFKRMSGNAAQFKQKPQSKPHKSKFSPSVQDTLTAEVKEKLKEPLPLALLKNTNSGLVSELPDEGVDILQKLLTVEQLQDPRFVTAINDSVTRLQIDPFGSGVTSIPKAKQTINSQPNRKIYSARPYRIEGVVSGTQTSKPRILFAVTNGQLAIYSVTSNHDEYERIIRLLS